MEIGTRASYLGIAFGLYFAWKKKSGVGGYIGYALIWSVVFGGVGSIVDYTVETLKK